MFAYAASLTLHGYYRTGIVSLTDSMFLLLICFSLLIHEHAYLETMCADGFELLHSITLNHFIIMWIYIKGIDKNCQHVLCDSFLELAQIETLAYKLVTIYDDA